MYEGMGYLFFHKPKAISVLRNTDPVM